MAPRATQADDTGRARKGNGFDSKIVAEFIGRIENLNEEITSQRMASAKRCREIGEDRDGVYDEAKNAGIPKNILKAEIRKRQLLAQAEALREKMEQDEQDLFDQPELSMGALGSAAKEAHKPN